MLTYRTGAAGAVSSARAMGEHLLQQTLPPEMAAMAEYYAQGMSPPTPAEAAAARYAHEASAGRLPGGELLDPIVEREIDRLAETATGATGAPVPRDELAMRAIGALLAAELIDRPEAEAALARRGQEGADDRLDAAVLAARSERDRSSATAMPRRDMNPALAERLGIDTSRGLTNDAALAIPDLAVAIAPTPENGCSKPCWAVSHLVATASKQRLQATASRVTAEQLGAIRRQIALVVGVET